MTREDELTADHWCLSCTWTDLGHVSRIVFDIYELIISFGLSIHSKSWEIIERWILY